jgi:hypothetical protein
MDNDLLGADQMPSAYEDWKSIKTSPAKVNWKDVREGCYFVVGFVGLVIGSLLVGYYFC